MGINSLMLIPFPRRQQKAGNNTNHKRHQCEHVFQYINHHAVNDEQKR